jgi:hypothetical protein
MTLTSTTRLHLRRGLVFAMVSSAIAAPAAAADQDLRMPDTRDAASAAQQSHRSYTDLRSPDARDAGRAAATVAPASPGARYADLRSPDARDAARSYASTPTVVAASTADGFDWASALIGAAAGAGILLALLAALAGSRRLRVMPR